MQMRYSSHGEHVQGCFMSRVPWSELFGTSETSEYIARDTTHAKRQKTQEANGLSRHVANAWKAGNDTMPSVHQTYSGGLWLLDHPESITQRPSGHQLASPQELSTRWHMGG